MGEYLIEELARIPVEVEYASELRYRNPPIDNHTLVFAITQSGETADTLAAMREMKRKGHPRWPSPTSWEARSPTRPTAAFTCTPGPEIGVASTKAFTSQCMALTLLALYFGRLRHLSCRACESSTNYKSCPTRWPSPGVRRRGRRIAEKYTGCNNFLYLGRQFNFPTALEGALKLKEISYIHAEGYPAAEMKHGPIALVDEHTPSVFLIPPGPCTTR